MISDIVIMFMFNSGTDISGMDIFSGVAHSFSFAITLCYD